MTRVRKVSLAVLAVLLTLCVGVGLSSCGKKDETPVYGYGEEGNYYYDASDGSEYILTLQKGTAIQSYDGGGSTAEYAYDVEENLMIFTEEGEDVATGSLTEGNLTVTYNGRSYLFLSYVYYTVTFSDGSSTITTQSVLNGKAASDPGDASKEGYVFLGWYADAAFTAKYEFNTSVTSDTTIYARFVEVSGATEYKITFDYTGETTETINGVVYNLPEPEMEGYAFLGWWVSATNQADELTYKYEGETLCEDTTLYAFWASGTSYMGASVRDDGITWENYSAAVTEIILRDEEGTEIDRFGVQSTDGRYAYDFASLPAGRYTLVIQGGGIDETLTYVSHALARVSGFNVVSGSILMYDEVPGAETYYISIDCGNATHDHTLVDNGTSLYYDFSSCDMPAEGITFTVYACAEGYYYSVSSYNFFLGLGSAEVSVSDNAITWTAVPYAMQYEIYIDGILVATTYDTSWSLANYGTGTYEISVKPVTTGYYSEASDVISFTKTTLASPSITGIEDYTITWTAVEGATGYIVKIGDTETTVEEGITSLVLTDENYTEGLDEYEISVKAMAADSANDSPYGETITVTGSSVGSAVSYSNGIVTWQYSLSASEYRITVNDGDEISVTGTNSSPVTLTKSGNNEITICFINDEGDIYGTASVTVYAYAIVFDARGGTAYMDGEEIDTIYVAKGDAVTLPEADMGAITADFLGWYTLPVTVDNPDATEYEGDGVLFEDGAVFTGNSTIVLYAAWLNPRLKVTLDPVGGTLADEDGNRITETEISLNGRNYTVAVPETTDAAYVFYGWYSGENGTGTRYTDENGNAYAAFDDISVTTLYARWIEVLSFSATTYNGSDTLAVSKGSEIDLVSEVTIPETYVFEGEEQVVEVISGSAFNSCSNLKTINIPDTMLYMDISANGYSAGVFKSTPLENVNIYVTGEPSTTKEVVYYSYDGALFWINTLGNVELLYYPYGRTGDSFIVPDIVSNENELEYSGLSTVPVVRTVNAIGNSIFRDHTELVSIVIPESVTVIGTYLFYGCTSLTDIVFEAELTKIEDYTFYGCSSLTDFDIADSVKEIGNRAFYNCTGLVHFTLPDSVETMGTYCFYGCTRLENIELSNSLTAIPERTFYNCVSLKGIDIPVSVLEIGTYAFYGCESLVKVVMQDTLTTIGTYAFYNCTSLSDLTLSGGITTINDYDFRGCTSLTTLVIPEGVTTINQYAFYGCSSIRSLSLPSTLKTIGNYAFNGCVSLMTVTIPANVTSIGTAAFMGCYKLIEVYNLSSLDIVAGASTYGDVAYYAKNVFTDLSQQSQTNNQGGFIFVSDVNGTDYSLVGYDGTDTDLVLPTYVDGQTYDIGQYALYGMSTITSVYIPETVTAIGQYAFYGCTSMESVNIPDGITSIPTYCFYNCSSLVSIVLPDSLTSIGSYAFSGCKGLVRITLGTGLTSVGSSAFADCYKLVEIENHSDMTFEAGSNGNGYIALYAKNICASADDTHLIYENDYVAVYDEDGNYFFVGFYGTGTDITFPADINGHTYEIMPHAFDGNRKIASVAFGDGVTSIGDYAFNECMNLASVTFGKSLTYLGDHCFYLCTLITSITIPDGLVEIGAYCFYGCEGLQTLRIGEDVETIGAYAFYECTSLTRVTLPDGLKYLGNYCFYNCTKLSNLNLPKSVQYIGDYVFYQNSGITSLSLSEGVYYIGQYAFYGCPNLGALNLKGTDIQIGNRAFASSGVTEVVMDYETITMGTYVFYQCYSLKSVTIDASEWADIGDRICQNDTAITYAHVNGARVVGSGLFYDCTGIEYAEFGGPTTSMGNYCFHGCTSLKEAWILPGTQYLANYMFYDCSALTTLRISGLTDSNTYVCYKNNALVNLTIDEGVEFLGQYMFYQCNGIKEVTIPSTVTRMNNGPFYQCTGIEKVTFVEGATYIGSSMFNGCTSLKDLYLPSTIETIESSAFSNCMSLENVYVTSLEGLAGISYGSSSASLFNYATNIYVNGELIDELELPEGTTKIGKYAFYGYKGATVLTIPSTVTEIGSSAFYNCYNLEVINYNATNCADVSSSTFYDAGIDGDGITVYIGANVERIPADLFYSSSSSHPPYITSIVFEEGSVCKEIGGYAFRYLSDITSIELPASLETISGSYAFANCTSLETVTFLGSNITSIANYAFYNCSSLVRVDVPDLGTWAQIELGGYQANPLYYGADIYVGGELMTDIDLPEGITQIGAYAFYGFGSAKTITIPSTVTSIGNYAFRDCTNVSEINFNATACVDGSSSSNYIFYNVGKNTDGVTLTIGANVTRIPNYMFYPGSSSYVPNITSITFEEGSVCEYIGNYAFRYVTVSSVELPSTVIYIGQYAFANCTSLKSFTIPAAVTELGTYVFYSDTGLESVTFEGTAMTTVGNYAFQSCSNLKYVYITDLGAWASISFGGYYGNPLNLGAGLYLNGSLVTDLNIPEGTTSIGAYAFYGYSFATSITIPSTVTSIGNYAFYNTYYVTEINYNATACADLTSGSNYIFYYTGRYAENGVALTIGASVTKIPDYMFSPYNSASYAPNIVSIVFEEGSVCESIGSYAFRYLSGITSIEIPASVKTIGSYAFYNCTNLTSIVLPDAVTEIATYTFYGCSSLEWVVIGSNVTSIGNYAFNGCSKLSAVYFMGDETAWNAISVGSSNSPLTSATVYYYSATAPATDGNFWYYVDGVPAVWKKD